eukprot:1221941-Prorocentrum_lima.AAC.1
MPLDHPQSCEELRAHPSTTPIVLREQGRGGRRAGTEEGGAYGWTDGRDCAVEYQLSLIHISEPTRLDVI